MRFSFFEDNNGKYANLTKRAFREVHLYNLLNKNYWLWIWGDRQIMTAFHAEIPLKGFMKIMFEKWIAEEKHFMSLILLFKPIYIHPPQIEFLSTDIQPPLLGRQFSKCGSAECFLGGCPCHTILLLSRLVLFRPCHGLPPSSDASCIWVAGSPVNSSRTEVIRILRETSSLMNGLLTCFVFETGFYRVALTGLCRPG